MKKAFRITGYTILTLITTIIAVYGAVYYAVAKGWTDEEGQVDSNNYQYEQSYLESIDSQNLAVIGPSDERTVLSKQNACQLLLLSKYAPVNSKLISDAYRETRSDEIESRMIFAAGLRVPELKDSLDKCSAGNSNTKNSAVNITANQNNLYSWANTEEWPIIVEAISKDKEKIIQAANAADLDYRMLLAPLAVEQLRLYFSQREYYEKFFKPLKILVTTNQMAWGVMAIKQKSAVKIENNLKDISSPYYLGRKYEHLLDFSSNDQEGERLKRLTDEKDHYWSYLYGALYIKQLETQWKNSGYPIDQRPEVVATLYNLGFEKSKPKKNPEVGGSTIQVGGADYTFGGLGFEIYYSGEMMGDYPFPKTDSNI